MVTDDDNCRIMLNLSCFNDLSVLKVSPKVSPSCHFLGDALPRRSLVRRSLSPSQGRINTTVGSGQYHGRVGTIPRYGRINKAVSAPPSTGSYWFFDRPFRVVLQALLGSISGPFVQGGFGTLPTPLALSVDRLDDFGGPTGQSRWTDSTTSVDRLDNFGGPTRRLRWTDFADSVDRLCPSSGDLPPLNTYHLYFKLSKMVKYTAKG